MTRVLKVQAANADDPAIREAADMLRDGALVAFPTETVYGLGAVAGNENSVRKVFVAKGRPASVPLIVHVRDVQQARRYVNSIPDHALAMAEAHWPGPLTLVLDRSRCVSDAVTAGGDNVGVRVPDHPVALALLQVLGEGIAAPSANLYDRLPPVRAEHVMDGLAGRIDAVLDGGRCPSGLESTVVDAREIPVRVMRRGMVDTDQLGVAAVDQTVVPRMSEQGWIRVGEESEYDEWAARNAGANVGANVGASIRSKVGRMRLSLGSNPLDAREYSGVMYDVLHEFWRDGCERVWVDAPPLGGQWTPIWDRLARLSWIVRGADG